MLVMLILMVMCVVYIANYYRSRNESERQYEELKNQVTSEAFTEGETHPAAESGYSKPSETAEDVYKRQGLNIEVGGLKKMVSVSNPVNTRLLEISVTNEDPYLAKNIADAIALISADRIVEIMGIEKVNVWDEGNIPNGPSSPSLSKNAAIAGVLGLVLSCAVILIIFILDDRCLLYTSRCV